MADADNANDISGGQERWLAFFVDGAAVGDTVYIVGYTWGSGGWDLINGLDSNNDAGANNLAQNRTAGQGVIHIIRDDGDSPEYQVWNDGAGGNNIDSTVEDDTVTREMHNKLVYVSSRGLITGSTNLTGGATSAQANDMLLIFPENTLLIDEYEKEMDELRSGVFHDNTWHDTHVIFYKGDTIEVFFSPDDQGHIPSGLTYGRACDGTHTGALTGGHSALTDARGVICRLIANANQSVFYAWNRHTDNLFGTPDRSTVGHFLDASDKLLVAGCLDYTTNSTTEDTMNFDHTCRDGDDKFGGSNQMHAKFTVIDQEVVATGSMNHTGASMSFSDGNDENEVVIHSFRLARKYLAYWRRIMSMLNRENIGQTDRFDSTSLNSGRQPGEPANLAVTPAASSFTLTWSGPTVRRDSFTRYFVFIDSAAINSNYDIGDGIDNDNDNRIDEDPRGDADRFTSGASIAGATADDDDGDNSQDEDPWLWPEYQAKNYQDTALVATTYNYGEAFSAGVNYWFAVVAVDTFGNESLVDTSGPHQLGAADTKIVLTKNSNVADTSGSRGDSRLVIATLFVRGDTSVADTLTIFAVKNLGTADSQDVVVQLWRDENGDSTINPIDTFVAYLNWSTTTSRYQATIPSTDSRARLGTTGKTFLVALDIYDTAGIGDTFQVQIDASTCSASRRDSGPTAAVTNTGKLTIVSGNPVDVAKRGDFASVNIHKGAIDSAVWAVQFSVGTATDTLQVFTVRNLGTMSSSDVSALRLYHDGDGDSIIDAAPIDTWVAGLRFMSGSDWKAETIAYRFNGTALNLILALSTSGGATAGATFQPRVTANSADAITADTGPSADVSATGVFTIPTDTAPDASIVLNEYISDPSSLDHDTDGNVGDADEEFYELYNNSDGSVDVGSWKLDDDSVAGGGITLAAGIVLGPRQYLAVYADVDSQTKKWYRYDSSGTVIMDSGTYTGTWNQLNNTFVDWAGVENVGGTIIDSGPLNGYSPDKSYQREWDGASTWKNAVTPTPGKNRDRTSFSTPSPNAHFRVTVSDSDVNAGDSFTVTIQMKDQGDTTIANFTQTATIRAVTTGTFSPTTTGSFSAGARSESMAVYGVTATESVIITAVFNTNTTGTTAITVYKQANVTCTVSLEARPANAASCTGFLSSGTYQDTQVSNAAGTITFSSVPGGTYSLTTKENHHLRKITTGIVISGVDTSINIGSHRAGDANNDNVINVFDGAMIKQMAVTGVGTAGDIDGSGTVNAADLSWARLNFGRRGD